LATNLHTKLISIGKLELHSIKSRLYQDIMEKVVQKSPHKEKGNESYSMSLTELDRLFDHMKASSS